MRCIRRFVGSDLQRIVITTLVTTLVNALVAV